jgi:hypothetical protein
VGVVCWQRRLHSVGTHAHLLLGSSAVFSVTNQSPESPI